MTSAQAWADGLRLCQEAIAKRTSFLIETTLAGRDPTRPPTYLKLMSDVKRQGFRVDLTFIALENADVHVARVADRVAAGLHDIPEQRIRERYDLSLSRAADALHIADHALLIDNSSARFPFRAVAEFDRGRVVALDSNLPRWAGTVMNRFAAGIGSTERDP